MEYSKAERYKTLVEKFRTLGQLDSGLLNPHQVGGFRYDVINPWELWHNNLDAEIMLIGQDFCDSASLESNLASNWEKESMGQTNKQIIDFFSRLGERYTFKTVDYSPKEIQLPLFFTNAILGIKESLKNQDGKEIEGMSMPVKFSWFHKSSCFLKELINIVQPRFIIAMGAVAYKAVCSIKECKPKKLENAIEEGPFKLNDGEILFVVGHCSGLGKRNRSLLKQQKDWDRIGTIIRDINLNQLQFSLPCCV